MYQARNAGGDRYMRFSADMDARVTRRPPLQTSLRRALEREGFKIHYQPQISLRDGSIVGMEALVRRERPDIGPVPPDDFIHIAEATGLTVPISARCPLSVSGPCYVNA